MKDIDFIKWMCEKADGFELLDRGHFGDSVRVPNSQIYYFDTLESEEETLMWPKITYPLLLQRAIEGVNRNSIKDDGFLVDINCSDITVYHTDTRVNLNFLHDSEDYDTAKESALRYIYEQESDK